MSITRVNQQTPLPWSYRRMKRHFVIEAANGVRVAEIRFIGRPDGTTSEDDARRIVAAVNFIETIPTEHMERDNARMYVGASHV